MAARERRGGSRPPHPRSSPGRGQRDHRRGSGQGDGGRVGARQVAYDVLRAVADRDAYANLLLPARLRKAGLDRRDAALATELTYGTLRGLGTYDEVVRACSDRGLEGIDPPLLDVLRLGAHQLLATRIPDHAAVGETVSLSRAVLDGRRARFANAVLRKMATRDLTGWLAIVAPDERDDPTGHLAVAYSHPRWIVSAVRDALGGDVEETRRMLAADNDPAPVTLTAVPGRLDREEMVASGAEPATYSPYAAHLQDGDPATIPAVRTGGAVVQDEGSQLVTVALASTPLDGADGAWLDLCAGPGGKAALLGGLAAARGGRVLAVDRQEHRARLVGRAAGSSVAVAVADGTVPAWPAARFDRVLVDVPCSGLGALRRRPELRWRRTPQDVAAVRPLQRELLSAALEAARPGGVVAYATCTPHLAETRVVVDDVLARHAAVERLDARSALPGVPHLGTGPYVQLWPHRHDTDAMFLALLRTPA